MTIEHPQNIAAVIVAAGQGTRLGASVPKAFIDLNGSPLFAYSLRVLATHPRVRHVALVVPQERLRESAALAAELELNASVDVVAGGSERWESVRNGVRACPAGTDTILVHDAARPFVTHAVMDALIAKAGSYRAVVTVTEVVDTIRRFEQDRAGETLDRSQLVRVGTPQLFRTRDLESGFARASGMPKPPTDEAVLMQLLGIDVGIAWGDPHNFKITSPGDLESARAILAAREKISR